MADILAVLKADTSDFSAKLGAAKAEVKDLGDSGGSSLSKLGAIGKTALVGVGGALVAVGAYSLDAGMKFQTAMTDLVTGAGESQKNIGLVSSGILNMAGQVGFSAQTLAGAMFTVESAGFHGAQGLTVLKAAAEGAKVGNADLGTVADAVTSTLNAYGLKANDATDVTNELVETVASGKMHMQDLAGAISAVLPVAAAAHISFAQVGGAIATMTSQGTSAQQASQDLAATIRALQNPSEVQISEMEQLGLNANNVSTQLGKKGLTGTLSELVGAITNQMGPAGTVLLNTFKQSQSASQDAQTMLHALPPSMQSAAQAFANGQVSVQQWRTDVKALPADQQALATQFASMVQKTHSFNSALSSGSPAAQTFNAALSKVMGGSTGLDTALQITGGHMGTFNANVAAIGKSGHAAGTEVQGFAEVQKDLAFKLTAAKDGAEALATRLGLKLIPVVTSAIAAVQSIVVWLGKHKDVAIALAVVIGGVLATAIGAFIILQTKAFIEKTGEAIKSVTKLGSSLADFATQTMGKLVGTNTAIADSFAVEGDAATAAGEETDAAFGPIGIAIGAIAVGAYEIIKHWGAVSKFFKTVWADVKKVFDDAWHGIKDVVKVAWNLIKTYLEDFTIVGLVASHWNTIKTDTVRIWDDIVSFVTGIPSKIVNALKDLGSKLLSWITGVWDHFSSWVKTAWDAEVTFWTTLPEKLINAVITLGSRMLSWIETAWNNFKSWIESAWNTEIAFWTGLPSRIISAVTALGGMLLGWAEQAWDQVLSGFTSAWNDVSTWLGSVAGMAVSALGDVGNDLLQAGKNIMNGLWNGLKDVWNQVTSWLSGLNPAHWKGPPARDAVMLYESGQLIMRGLHQGMADAFNGEVIPFLQGATNRIAGTNFGASATITPIAGLGGGATSGAGGGTQPVYLQIDGQTFASLMLPYNQTAALRAQRSQSLPVFGTTQSAA